MDTRLDFQKTKKNSKREMLTSFHNYFQKRLQEKCCEDKVNALSHKFANHFLEVLRRCFGNDKVQSDTVYMQCLLHKGHVHITKTRWKTLEDFVKYQGRLGTFLVEYFSKVWYVQSKKHVVSSEFEQCQTSDESSNKVSLKLQNALRLLSKQNLTTTRSSENQPPSRLHEGTSSMNKWTTIKRQRVQFKVSARLSPYNKDRKPEKIPSSKPKSVNKTSKKTIHSSALKEIMEEDARAREQLNRSENWLQSGIVVRICSDRYGRQNNRKRCRIVGTLSPRTAVVQVFSTDDVLTVDQRDLRTCVPQLEGIVLIVNGAYRNEKAVVERISANTVECCLRITGSPLSGRREILSADELLFSDEHQLLHPM